MIRNAVVLLLCVLAIAACGRRPDTTEAARPLRLPPQQVISEPDYDIDNLLNVTYGASVIWRTAELNLEHSAAHAIDGITSTVWVSPPRGPNQTFVFSLGAPSRIERVGVTPLELDTPENVRFEGSTDGRTWREMSVIQPRAIGKPQVSDIEPADASYLRISVTGTKSYHTRLRSIHVEGRAIAPPALSRLDGCWAINGQLARFSQEGARVIGIIGSRPMIVDGGTDGQVTRLMWIRGPMWGYAAVTLGPDGRALTGVTFHEEAAIQHAGAAWFGAPCGDASNAPRPLSQPERFLQRAGRWSMYGLAFDSAGRLIEAPSRPTLDAAADLIRRAEGTRFRLIAREFRGSSAEENRQTTASQIAALRSALAARGVNVRRIDFVAAGSDWTAAPISVSLQRLLASRVDLELAPR